MIQEVGTVTSEYKREDENLPRNFKIRQFETILINFKFVSEKMLFSRNTTFHKVTKRKSSTADHVGDTHVNANSKP